MWKFVRGFAGKSGTTFHPTPNVTEAVVRGLAVHADELGKPLCPCNFYPDKQAEIKLRRREDGLPITEYLPEDHEGRQVCGVVTDPAPDKGRALRHRATAQSGRESTLPLSPGDTPSKA